MMTTFSENNMVYTEYIKFSNFEDMMNYITTMNKAYKDKDESIIMHMEPKIFQLYIKITKYKVWIKEPYFTLN